MYKIFFKRLFDLVISFICLLIFLPIIIFVGLVLFILNKGNVFFVQQRPGLNGVIFNVIKFKTMNDRRDISGNLLPDRMRITKFGKFVRSSSIDELPQLWNVLIGDMSLIGPRPLLVKYIPLYSESQKRRHNVKPGITGWAQVNGRNAISWEEKFNYDIYYVENLSFLLDVKIFWLTFIKVFRREGISNANAVTMPEFKGTSKI